MQYFLYARKSTDSEDRQMLSIEAQIQELRDFARQNKLSIVKIFTESMSAKQPGRLVFNQMLTELEQGQAQGIIAWHPDRIARNTYDGGKVTYLIDQGIIKDLKFPNFYFDKTANGKFNLSIAFSQAQYFVDGLRENVNRGIRQKIRRGEFPGKAPYGYINHHKTRSIEPDPEHFNTMKKLLERFADAEIDYKEMRDLMYASGIKGARNERAVSFSSLHNLLTNPFYYGVFKLRGELHEGSHKPMISKETFDKIQKRIKINSRKTNHKKARQETNFFFPNIASCGDCGYSITFEKHKSRSRDELLKYYRCSDKKPDYKCTQRKYLREEELGEQVKSLITQVAIPDDVVKKLEQKSYEWQAEDTNNSKVALQGLSSELDSIRKKLENLLDLQLDGEINLDEYKAKKNNLVEKKAELQHQIKEIQQDPYGSLEKELAFLESCNRAYHSLKNKNYSEMNKLIQKFGSNRKTTNQKLEIQFIRPFDFLSEFLLQTGYSSSHDEPNLVKHCNHELNSKDGLVKRDSFAVCEPSLGSYAWG
jgi:site-specific DNA recombinase